MSRESADKAHPAFAKILGLLAPDEAKLLSALAVRNFSQKYRATYKKGATPVDIEELGREILSSDVPAGELAFPRNCKIYLEHLSSLSLVSFSINDRRTEELAVYGTEVCHLTPFGRMMMQACNPEKRSPQPV
jgi:hypothetical protein